MNCFKRILPAFIIALFLACSGDFKEITDEERQARLPQLSSSSEDLSSSSSNLGVSSSNSGSSSSDGQSTAERSSSSSSVVVGGSSSSSGSISLCGGTPYNTASEFCSEGAIYAKCGGNTYEHATHFCLEGVKTEKCGGMEYEAGQECLDDKIIGKCEGKSYNVESGLCHNGSVLKTYFTDERDRQRYLSVKIGEQTWMAENLNFAADSSKCVGASNASGNLVDNGGRCSTYGRLYNWATAMSNSASSSATPSGVQGVCPPGWHLPSDAEWNALTTAVGGTGTNGLTGAGAKLRAASGWSGSGNGTDDYGFSALPGGLGSGTSFYNVGNYGGWWSITESNASSAYNRYMNYNDSNVIRGSYSKTNLVSVRCVQN